MSFELKRASRQGVKPLIGLYGESGTGKTYSALLLARGLVGAAGRIAMIDTESGRGSLYADVLPGGYEVLELRDPFSPARYIEAMTAIEASGVAVGIIDSGSHEWEGISGVLDMATEIEEKSGKPGLHCWKAPKMAHNLWLRKLLQSPLPWIICLRAKYKSRQGKNESGKTVIIKDEATSPIQAEDFIFECTAHAEILQDHSIILTKCSHPALRDCFPARSKGPITIGHGEALARWCAAAGDVPRSAVSTPSAAVSQSAVAPVTPKPKLTDEEKKARWLAACLKAAGGASGASYVMEYFVSEGWIMDTEAPEDISVGKLPKTREEADKHLAGISIMAGVSTTPT